MSPTVCPLDKLFLQPTYYFKLLSRGFNLKVLNGNCGPLNHRCWSHKRSMHLLGFLLHLDVNYQQTLMWIINKPGRILSGVTTISLILEQFDIYQVSCSILMAYLLREIFPASGKISPGKPANSLSIIFDHDYFLLHQIMG